MANEYAVLEIGVGRENVEAEEGTGLLDKLEIGPL